MLEERTQPTGACISYTTYFLYYFFILNNYSLRDPQLHTPRFFYFRDPHSRPPFATHNCDPFRDSQSRPHFATHIRDPPSQLTFAIPFRDSHSRPTFATHVRDHTRDKSWKGTTEQFILHFNEQFRQLDEVSPPEESLPFTTRLTLLQTAVHNIPELRMVETMEKFIILSSSTPGPTMGYDNYLTLLQNACIRYDSNLKSRPSPASRAAYQHELSHDQHDNPYPQDYSSSGTTYGGIDMPAEEFYQVHTTNLNRPPNVSTITPRKPTSSHPPGRPTPRRSPGPIFLPANIYKLLSDVAIKEIKKHNATTRSTPPPKRAVNTHGTNPSHEQPPTDTPTGDPTPPESPADPDLDNNAPCEDFTFDDSTLEHIMDTYSLLLYQ